jgi:hypothetical protein
MQLSGNIAAAGGTPVALDVQADVSLGPDPAGGFHLTGIALTVRGEVEGLDAAGFEKAAQDAKAGCPVSKALTGVEITLDAALEGRPTRPPVSVPSARVGGTGVWVGYPVAPLRFETFSDEVSTATNLLAGICFRSSISEIGQCPFCSPWKNHGEPLSASTRP